MICPHCGAAAQVLGSRMSGQVKVRRRECLGPAKHRFSTREVCVDSALEREQRRRAMRMRDAQILRDKEFFGLDRHALGAKYGLSPKSISNTLLRAAREREKLSAPLAKAKTNWGNL